MADLYRRRTPGTGKTTHAAQVVEQLLSNPSTSAATWQHVNVGDFVKDKGCHSGYNEEWQSWDVDEDKVISRSSFLLAPSSQLESRLTREGLWSQAAG